MKPSTNSRNKNLRGSSSPSRSNHQYGAVSNTLNHTNLSLNHNYIMTNQNHRQLPLKNSHNNHNNIPNSHNNNSHNSIDSISDTTSNSSSSPSSLQGLIQSEPLPQTIPPPPPLSSSSSLPPQPPPKKNEAFLVNAAQNLTFLKLGSPTKAERPTADSHSMFSIRDCEKSVPGSLAVSSSNNSSATGSTQSTPLTPPKSGGGGNNFIQPSELDLGGGGEKKDAVMLAAFAIADLHSGATPPPTPSKDRDSNAMSTTATPVKEMGQPTNLQMLQTSNIYQNTSYNRIPTKPQSQSQYMPRTSPPRSPKRKTSRTESEASDADDDETKSSSSTSGSNNGNSSSGEDDDAQKVKRSRLGSIDKKKKFQTLSVQTLGGGEIQVEQADTPVSSFLTSGFKSAAIH